MSTIVMRSFASRSVRPHCSTRAVRLKATIKSLEKTIKRIGRLAPDMPDVPCVPLCDDADEPYSMICAAHVATIVALTAVLIVLKKKDEEDG